MIAFILRSFKASSSPKKLRNEPNLVLGGKSNSGKKQKHQKTQTSNESIANRSKNQIIKSCVKNFGRNIQIQFKKTTIQLS